MGLGLVQMKKMRKFMSKSMIPDVKVVGNDEANASGSIDIKPRKQRTDFRVLTLGEAMNSLRKP